MVSVAQGSCRPHGCNQKHNHYRFLLDNFLQYLGKDDLIIYHQSGSYLLQDVNGAVDSQKTFDDDYFKVDYENLDMTDKNDVLHAAIASIDEDEAKEKKKKAT